MDCLFCKIIGREIPGSIVYEDDHVIAFNDIKPQAPTHVLVVPKRHIESLNELQPGDDQIVGELIRRAAAIAQEQDDSKVEIAAQPQIWLKLARATARPSEIVACWPLKIMFAVAARPTLK